MSILFNRVLELVYLPFNFNYDYLGKLRNLILKKTDVDSRNYGFTEMLPLIINTEHCQAK